ncbi:WD40-repeat-containing domain protein [Mycena galopus ATCC 62051]|nr:WD40-repeat-containing domain protein [Mycena galopus ATCC 62051]
MRVSAASARGSATAVAAFSPSPWKAIPCGAPPVGSLRFKAPRPLAPQNSTVPDKNQDFDGVITACVQFGTTSFVGVNASPGIEDCLKPAGDGATLQAPKFHAAPTPTNTMPQASSMLLMHTKTICNVHAVISLPRLSTKPPTSNLRRRITSSQLFILTQHYSAIAHPICIFPPLYFFYTLFDTTIRVWDAELSTQITAFTIHTYIITSLTFNSDATRLVSGSWDATVRVWDPSTGDYLFTSESHTSGLNSVAHSPNGRRLLSGSDDKTVRLWDAATRVEIGVVRTHSHWVSSVAFSLGRSAVAAVAWDNTGAI